MAVERLYESNVSGLLEPELLHGAHGASTVTQVPTLASVAAKLADIEDELNAALIDRSEAIRAALVALVAGEHLVILGPPGASKSHLVDSLTSRIAGPGGGVTLFAWQLNRFTVPEDLFGPISVQGLKRDEYRRIVAGKLPEAHIAFLDEVFKASNSIQNTLLLLMNERRYDNGTERLAVPLLTLFGASNELPESAETAAAWDRFLLRIEVAYVADGDFARLLRLDGPPAAVTTVTLQEIAVAQECARALVAIPDAIYDQLARLRVELRGKGIIASDRRWRQALGALRAHALLEGRGAVDEDDLAILAHILWQTPEQRHDIARCVARVSNPTNARAAELGDQAASVAGAALAKRADTSLNATQKMEAVIDALAKLGEIKGELDALRANVAASAGNTAKVDRALTEIAAQQAEFLRLATGA